MDVISSTIQNDRSSGGLKLVPNDGMSTADPNWETSFGETDHRNIRSYLLLL